jgi:radical SAM superfamily enzyme YgiQ (UPF0313 family)
LRDRGAVLLVSCYELGQQPLGLASADAHLTLAGFKPDLIDVAVDPLDERRVTRAGLVAISAPMHTALMVGLDVARRVRTINPGCHITFFGLYAALNAAYLLDTVADSCLGGEFEQPLIDLVTSLDTGADVKRFAQPPDTEREFTVARRTPSPLPQRDRAPSLDRYARLDHNDDHRLVGYVATSRGCRHLCRHCPLPPVYRGRFYVLPVDVVIEDIRQLIAAGAQHITFADPDFLNGPGHARRIARALHQEFSTLTFDFTAKIEHLIKQKALVGELQELGCVFVVSAVESLSEKTLVALRKGHTPADAIDAMRFFKSMGLTLRPTFVPFTPWDTLEDYRALLEAIEGEGMIDHVDSVQYSIRLLVPPRSSLVASKAMSRYLGSLDRSKLTHEWHHPDPRMDDLQQSVAALVEKATRTGEDTPLTFFKIVTRTSAMWSNRGVLEPDHNQIALQFPRDRVHPPRLTENWFC